MTQNHEETLVLVKPDGVARGLTGQILARIEAKGYVIAELKMLTPNRDMLVKHYEEHEGKPFFEPLVEFMGSGPVVAARVTGRRRAGPERAQPNQIASSRSAERVESEPWTRFFWTASPQSRPRSPRMVPGAATVGSVLPASERKPSITESPVTRAATTGPEAMNATSGSKNGLPWCSS